MRSPAFLIASCSIALVLSLLGFMAPAAVLGDIMRDWSLSNTEAGWLGGALFAGYIASVPILTAYTDRIDPKRIYMASAMISVIGNLGFGFLADGLWSGVAFRVLTGIGLAGTYMPGLKALSDQLPAGRVQQRGATYYTSVFALGSGLSIFVGGVAADMADWRLAFAVAGAGAAVALVVVGVVLPFRAPEVPDGIRPPALDFRPVLRDGGVMSFVFSFFGTAWEVFASRIWLVSFFAFLQSEAGGSEGVWTPTLLATVVALVGVPSAMFFGELSVRYDRRRILMGLAVGSGTLAVLIGAVGTASYELSIALCILFGIVSYGRTSSTTAGTIAAADPRRRGLALAVQAFVGFSGGILGPLAMGIALDATGGGGVAAAWTTALVVMAVGPVVSFAALAFVGRRRSA